MSPDIIRGVQALADALGLTKRTCERLLADETLEKRGLVELNPLGKIRRFDARSIAVVNFRRRTGGLRAVPSAVRRISA
jgi:DNA-binding IclR family transcriptional regulator